MIHFADFPSATIITNDKSPRVADVTQTRVTLYEDGQAYMARDMTAVKGSLDYDAKCSIGIFWVSCS